MRFLLFILLLVSSTSSAQLVIDSISIDYFYRAELKELSRLKNELKFKVDKAKGHIQIADVYADLNIEDSAYYHYRKAHEKLRIKPVTEEFLELLFKLHKTSSSKSFYSKDQRDFLNELFQLSDQSNYKGKWLARYHLELGNDYFADSLQFEKALEYYSLAQNSEYFENFDEFKVSLLLNKGSLLTSMQEYEHSKMILNEAMFIAKRLDNYQSLSKIYINLGVNEKLAGNPKQALHYFKNALDCPFPKNKPKIYRAIYRNLVECYQILGWQKELEESNLILEKLNLIIDDFRKNSNFYEIDVKYRVKENAKEIASLASKFKRHKFLYITFLSITFLLALYSYIRWKKEDKRKKDLENERSKLEIQHLQTIEELEKTKQLVIEDHIVLKNKSKVYLEELIFIKAEDHYLQLITKGKKEFVRGKLSEIIGQLPPNFVKCHRSFIVNKNEVKQLLKNEVVLSNGSIVPCSRGFKW